MRPDQFFRSTIPEFFTPELEQEFATIAMEVYPHEACAFVIKGKLVPVENLSVNPREQFELSTADSLLSIKAQGFIHSHPDGPIYPSGLDMKTQKSANIPFGFMTCTGDSASNSIWLSDKVLKLQLEERPFIHGISDCYALIRAYYLQSRDIILPDFPRDMDWWKDTDEDMYLKNFEIAGFRPLESGEEMEEGDIILMNIQSNVVSHAAIYLGNNLILHHLLDRISRKDQATSWKKFYHTVVRYNG